jgi:hypothetical protein
MNRKAVVLLSGGLDSTLAALIVKAQGIALEALNFQTMFGCCKDDARGVAYQIGIPYTTLKVGDDYLKVVQEPKHGYGKGINPCVDCRGYMFDLAKKFMDQTGASFLISGEVLGQRPMSQKMRDFNTIGKDTGLEGLILRPLSAHLLPETKPEQAGIVDRSRLYGIEGRSRSELVKLAKEFGVQDIPQPSTGCALTEPAFAKKVRDIFEHKPESYVRWEFEILKVGRHFRLDALTKVIISKDEQENAYLEAMEPPVGTVLLKCLNFGGPHALLVGDNSDANRERAAAVMLRYAHKTRPPLCEIGVCENGRTATFLASIPADEVELATLRIV